MTNVQLRAELFREINPLLDNEDPNADRYQVRVTL